MKKILFAIFLFSPLMAHAFLITDLAKLQTKIMASIEDFQYFRQEYERYRGLNEQSSTLSGLEIDAMNNAAANWVVRTNQARAKVAEIELLKKSTPAIDSCDSTAMAAASVNCSNVYNVASIYPTNWDDATKDANSLGKTNIVGTRKRYDPLLARAKSAMPESFSSGGGSTNGSNTSNGSGGGLTTPGSYNVDSPSVSFEAIHFLSSDSAYLTLNGEDMQASIDFIDLIAPPFVYTEQMKIDSKISNMNDVKNMRKQSVMSAYRATLQNILSLRTPSAEGISKLTALQEFSDTQMNLAKKIGVSELAVPDVVLRNRAIMKAFMVHMMVEEYRLSLQDEFNLAIYLSNILGVGNTGEVVK